MKNLTEISIKEAESGGYLLEMRFLDGCRTDAIHTTWDSVMARIGEHLFYIQGNTLEFKNSKITGGKK